MDKLMDYGANVDAEYFLQKRHSFMLSDCIEYLSSLPDASVDLVITDPAYESLEKHRKVGTTTRLKKQWFEIFPNSRYPELLKQLYRVMKKDTHFYCFCDQETALILWPLMQAAGFKVWKFLVWNKDTRGMGYHYPASHELILFAEKGKRKLNTNNVLDVLTAKPVTKKKGAYPTQKPIEIVKAIGEESSNPGDVVLDVFMGSAVVLEWALKTGRFFLGCDNSLLSIGYAKDVVALHEENN